MSSSARSGWGGATGGGVTCGARGAVAAFSSSVLTPLGSAHLGGKSPERALSAVVTPPSWMASAYSPACLPDLRT